MEATKLFFFKECLDKTNEALDSAFASRKGQIHIESFSAWLARVFLPSSFELQNHHDTILRRKGADARVTAATRARRITSASESTAEALALQAEARTSVNIHFLYVPPPPTTSTIRQHIKQTEATKQQVKEKLREQENQTP
jgi:hypothetical protein